MSDERLFSRDLDWNLLKVFDQVARSGGVSAAARQLERNQPALSLALKRFEDRLGTTLCRRGPGGFELLVEGEPVAETCRDIARLIEELPTKLADLSKMITGVLRLRMVCDIVCPELDEALRRFNKIYPNVQIQSEIGPGDTVMRAIQRNEADIGIASNRVQIADLGYEPLFREIHQAFCGRGFHLFGEQIRDLGDYADEPFLIMEVDEPDELRRFRAKTGIGRYTAASSNHIAELLRLGVLGVGLCFLPEGVAAPEVEAGRLWPLTPNHRDWGIDISMITNPEAPRQKLRRLFIDEVRAVKAEIAQASN